MKSFTWVQPASQDDALRELGQPGAAALGGGVDLLDRMKEGLIAPSRLVSLRGLKFDKLEVKGSAVIGSGVTLARLASDPALRASHAILAEAASHVATPQVRAMATLGGNLAQRTRCWYYRSELFTCRKKGGTGCFAHTGASEMHAIYGNQLCAATHPSTLATALIALGARLTVVDTAGKPRQVPLASWFIDPERDPSREADLAAGDLITEIHVPAVPASVRTAYLKQVAKQSFDWPILDAAVALELDGTTCRKATIVLGGVAPTPLRASVAERALEGKTVDERSARTAAAQMAATATPLAGNRYKVPVLEAVLARTIIAAVGPATTGRAS